MNCKWRGHRHCSDEPDVDPEQGIRLHCQLYPARSPGKNDSAEFVEQLGIGWSVEFNERAIGEFLDSITREEIRRKAARVPISANASAAMCFTKRYLRSLEK